MQGLNSSYKNRIKKQLALDQDFRCWLCGTRRPWKKFTLDHVTPRRFGGRNNRDNFKLACLECNLERGRAVERLLIPNYYT